MSCPTIFLFMAVILAKRNPNVIDYFGLSIMLPFCVTAYAFYLIPSLHVETNGPNFQNYVFGLIYLCSCHFMCSNFLVTFIIRQVLGWSFILLSLYMWQRLFEINIAVNALFFFTLVILVEGSNYCSMRSKALLFLRVKVMSMQEKQLSNLLDAIPDKVLISTRVQEARAPKSIYSNR